MNAVVNQTEQTSTPVKTGRYDVGQVIHAMCFIYDRHGEPMASTGMPFQWGKDGPTDIKFTAFTVTEHHRVPNHWDEKRTPAHDGYKLTDPNGVVFHNQFPDASYGQMSDTADRIFIHGCEALTKEDIDALVANEHITPFQWIHITDPLESIQRGIDSKDIRANNNELHTKLVALMEQIKQKFHEAFPGKTFELQPVFPEKEQLKDIVRAVVVDIPN